MTWNERKVVSILCGILAVLCAALLVVLGIRYRENRDEPEAPIDPVVSEEIEETGIAYLTLSYYNGSTTLNFSRDEADAWIWSDDASFPLDDSTITAICDLLTNFEPKETITDAETIANSGTAEPEISLAASTSKGMLTLDFGKTTEDGQYVRLNSDETTIYLLDTKLFELMCVPIFDMCVLPQMPALNDETLMALMIRGINAEDPEAGITTILSAQRTDGETAVSSWRSSGANVTDLPTVKALLEDVKAMQVSKCILYRPSEEAVSICGFDTPTAKLGISYLAEDGSEQLLELWIGNPLPDGSGRYVRLGDEPTVYLMTTDLLDPLMRVAAEGLN